jgi:hypothetical protein
MFIGYHCFQSTFATFLLVRRHQMVPEDILPAEIYKAMPPGNKLSVLHPVRKGLAIELPCLKSIDQGIHDQVALITALSWY